MSILTSCLKMVLISILTLASVSSFSSQEVSIEDFELTEMEIYTQNHYINELNTLDTFRTKAIALLLTEKDKSSALQSLTENFLNLGVECGNYYNLISMNLMNSKKGNYSEVLVQYNESLKLAANSNKAIGNNLKAIRAIKSLIAFSKVCNKITQLHLTGVTKFGRLSSTEFDSLNTFLKTYSLHKAAPIDTTEVTLGKDEDSSIKTADISGFEKMYTSALNWSRQKASHLYRNVYVEPRAAKLFFMEKNKALNALSPKAKQLAQVIEELSLSFEVLNNKFDSIVFATEGK